MQAARGAAPEFPPWLQLSEDPRVSWVSGIVLRTLKSLYHCASCRQRAARPQASQYDYGYRGPAAGAQRAYRPSGFGDRWYQGAQSDDSEGDDFPYAQYY